MDAVCSVGSEEIRFDRWGLDVVLTASQKGLGAPPGLSIVAVSQKAMKVSRTSSLSPKAAHIRPRQVYETRSTPVRSYYGGWHK